jgi:hypothetical protein
LGLLLIAGVALAAWTCTRSAWASTPAEVSEDSPAPDERLAHVPPSSASPLPEPVVLHPPAEAPAPPPPAKADKPPAAKPTPVPASQAAPPARRAEGPFGTRVQFVNNPAEAERRAAQAGKLLFLLHISGNFEDSRFT